MEMLILTVFLFLAFAFGGVGMVNMAFAEYSVQNEAQQIAMSEGRYGGYTTGEQNAVEQYIDSFCQKQNLDPSQAVLDVSASSNPASYGANVTATLNVPYNFQVLGGSIPGITLTGTGRSVSSYVSGMTPDVTYTAP
jgi:hypothetical protein